MAKMEWIQRRFEETVRRQYEEMAAAKREGNADRAVRIADRIAGAALFAERLGLIDHWQRGDIVRSALKTAREEPEDDEEEAANEAY